MVALHALEPGHLSDTISTISPGVACKDLDNKENDESRHLEKLDMMSNQTTSMWSVSHGVEIEEVN